MTARESYAHYSDDELLDALLRRLVDHCRLQERLGDTRSVLTGFSTSLPVRLSSFALRVLLASRNL
jgi:hypothetical protein